GGTNSATYIGNIAYTPIAATRRSTRLWGINQSITYGSTEILRSTAGIIDCGCTFLWIASDAFESCQVATGTDWDPATNFLTITTDKYDALRDLEFHIDVATYSLTRNTEIWLRSLNDKVDGGANDIYLVVRSISRRTGSGLDFINGYVFLQRFYTVFDTSNSHPVGFATTQFTYATTN
ncbi:aspartic peptidase domain-containing protein, partial [Suillus spraguei]